MVGRWLVTGICAVTVYAHSGIAANSEFEAWKHEQSAQFHSYLNDEQQAFKARLQNDWQGFELVQPRSRYSTPKPDKPSVAPGLEQTKLSEVPVAKPVPTDTPIAKPLPTVPKMGSQTVEVNYLGMVYRLPVVGSPQRIRLEKSAIADAWEQLYPAMSELAMHIAVDKEIARLSHWGLISLLHRYALVICQGEQNSSQFLLWAMLLELGYDARLAYDAHYLYALLTSKQKIYVKSSFNLEGRDYYVLTGRKPEKSLYTYRAEQKSAQVFDFSFRNRQPVEGLTSERRTLSDSHTGISVTYLTYPQLEEYYRFHPQLDFVWYFRIAPSDPHYLQLISELKSTLKGLSQAQQIRVLLSLVQYGFEYKKDHEQWGEEYYATPMHTLMLQAVDCEDRSFLFAYLVEQITGVQTVGVKYPGHLAVAVALPQSEVKESAVSVSLDGQKYYIADPTYIGADIGQLMPNFKGVTPEIIVTE